MPPLRFRSRLFTVLLLFAVLPAAFLTVGSAVVATRTLPLVGSAAGWERVAASGDRALDALRTAPLTAAQRQALQAHEQELRVSLEQARRFGFLISRAGRVMAALGFLGLVGVALFASRAAGHLSRQLSRPLDELVEWTRIIARGEPLPEGPPRKGAPEFDVLRRGMRQAAVALERGRRQARETERLKAFRESARQVAHELKNPLTPVRFAVARLRRDAAPELQETIEVLATETERLEAMARSFAQFGRLPEGPAAEVDVGELARQTARTAVPSHLPLTIEVDDDLPLVRGHHDALARALGNVLLNAVDACRDGGTVAVRVSAAELRGAPAVEVAVRDGGCGIPAERLATIWEPYVTHKAGGTGLGLAIARQTVHAHDGEVDASSRPGEGTEVRFVLPVAPASLTGEYPAPERG